MALDELSLTRLGMKSSRILEMKYYNPSDYDDIGAAQGICASPVYFDKRYTDHDIIFSDIMRDNVHEVHMHVYMEKNNPLRYETLNLLMKPNKTDPRLRSGYYFLMVNTKTGRLLEFNENIIDHREFMIAEVEIVEAVLRSRLSAGPLTRDFFCRGIRMLNPYMVQEVIEKIKSINTRIPGFWSYFLNLNYLDGSVVKHAASNNKIFDLIVIPLDVMNTYFRTLVLSGALEDLPEGFFNSYSSNLNYDRNRYIPNRECNNGVLLSILGGEGGIRKQMEYKGVMEPTSIAFTFSRSSYIMVDVNFKNHHRNFGFVQKVTRTTNGSIIHVKLLRPYHHYGVVKFHDDYRNYGYNHNVKITCTDLKMTSNHGEPNDGCHGRDIIPDVRTDLRSAHLENSDPDPNGLWHSFTVNDVWDRLSQDVTIPHDDTRNILIHFVINTDEGLSNYQEATNNTTYPYLTSGYYKYNPSYINSYSVNHIQSGQLITYDQLYTILGQAGSTKITVNDHIGVDVYGRFMTEYDTLINDIYCGRYDKQVDHVYGHYPAGTTVNERYQYEYGVGTYASLSGAYTSAIYGGMNDTIVIGSNKNTTFIEKLQMRSLNMPDDITTLAEFRGYRQRDEGNNLLVYYPYEDKRMIPCGRGVGSHLKNNDGGINEIHLYRGMLSVYHAMHIGNMRTDRNNIGDKDPNRPRSIMKDSLLYSQGAIYGDGIGADPASADGTGNLIELHTYNATKSYRGLHVGKNTRWLNGHQHVVFKTTPERYPFTVEDCQLYTDPQPNKAFIIGDETAYQAFNEQYRTTNIVAHTMNGLIEEIATPIYYVPYGKLDGMIGANTNRRIRNVFGYNQIMLYNEDNIFKPESANELYLNLWSFQEMWHYTKLYGETVNEKLTRRFNEGVSEDLVRFEPVNYLNSTILAMMRLPGAICNYIDKVSTDRQLNNNIGRYKDTSFLMSDNNGVVRNDVVNVLMKSALAKGRMTNLYTRILHPDLKFLRFKSAQDTHDGKGYTLVVDEQGKKHVYIPLFYIGTSHRTYIFNVDSHFLFELDMSLIIGDARNSDYVIHVALVAVQGDNNTIIFQDTHQQPPNNSPASFHESELKRRPTIEIILKNTGSIDAKVEFSMLANVYPTDKKMNLLFIRHPHLIRLYKNGGHHNFNPTIAKKSSDNLTNSDLLTAWYDRYQYNSLNAEKYERMCSDFGFKFYTESIWGSQQEFDDAESTYIDFLNRLAEDAWRMN